MKIQDLLKPLRQEIEITDDRQLYIDFKYD